jgi:hypothetical protein
VAAGWAAAAPRRPAAVPAADLPMRIGRGAPASAPGGAWRPVTLGARPASRAPLRRVGQFLTGGPPAF